ncbi:MAG: ankyrin repeat domain-containing protein [Gammaproteobacteria bacterium]
MVIQRLFSKKFPKSDHFSIMGDHVGLLIDFMSLFIQGKYEKLLLDTELRQSTHYCEAMVPLTYSIIADAHATIGFKEKHKMAAFYQQVFKSTFKRPFESKLLAIKRFRDRVDTISQHSSLLLKQIALSLSLEVLPDDKMDVVCDTYFRKRKSVFRTKFRKLLGPSLNTLIKDYGNEFPGYDLRSHLARRYLSRCFEKKKGALTLWVRDEKGKYRAKAYDAASLQSAYGDHPVVKEFFASKNNPNEAFAEAANDLSNNNPPLTLEEAIDRGDIERVKQLLETDNTLLEKPNKQQLTPFLYAAKKGQLEVLQLLQEKGANIHAMDEDGNNALHWASLLSGDVLTVAWLLELKKDEIESSGVYGRTAFLCAAQKGQLEVLKLLKEKGANIHAVNKYGNNALYLASLYSDDVSTVGWLLTLEGCDIDSRGQFGRTAFLLAAQKGQLEILQLLQEKGANIHAVDENGDNALHLGLLYSGNISMVRWLLDLAEYDVESCGQFKRTAFLCAAQKGQLEVLRLLEEKKVDVHVVDYNGNNALHLASMYPGDVSTVDWLLTLEGCDIDSRGQFGRTAFLLAAQKGQLEILQLLQKRGANTHVIDESGNNALHLASVGSGNVLTVEWLVHHGKLSINNCNKNQKTAFLCAAEQGHLAVLKKLYELDADIKAVGQNGSNALHYAALYSKNLAALKWLLEFKDLGIESRGYGGKTAFLCAAQKGQLEALRLLKEKNADVHVVDYNDNNALHYAALYSKDLAALEWLLELKDLGIESRGYGGKTAFLCAAKHGQLEVLRLLKEKNADVHVVDNNGNNALHYAALYSKDVSTVKWLLQLDELSIESCGYGGKTAFLCAAKHGHLEILKVLKDAGANIHVVDQYGNHALHLALAYSENVSTIEWLFGLNVFGIEGEGQYKRTPFLIAAQKGHLEILKVLKDAGSNIHAVDEYGNHALHLALLYSESVSTIEWLFGLNVFGIESEGQHKRTPFLMAAQTGQLEILQELKRRGANINAKDSQGNKVLQVASLFSNHVPTVTWLLDVQKCDIESKGKHDRSPFLLAAEQGQLEVLKLLKLRGANIHAVDKNNDNALHLAAMYSKNVSAVEWLLDLKKPGKKSVPEFDIDSRGQFGRTAFLLAAQKGQLKVLQLLKKKGANIHAVDENGDNALHLGLLYSGNILMVKWFLNLTEYDIESRGQFNRTAFLCAAQKGQLEVLRLLKEKNADVHVVDYNGNNALHLASMYSGDVSTIEWLLGLKKPVNESGKEFDIDSRGQFGRTAFLLAAQKGQLEILQLLQEKGANIHAVDENGDNALHLASLSGDMLTVSWLLSLESCDIERRGAYGWTAFLRAAEKDQKDSATKHWPKSLAQEVKQEDNHQPNKDDRPNQYRLS